LPGQHYQVLQEKQRFHDLMDIPNKVLICVCLQ